MDRKQPTLESGSPRQVRESGLPQRQTRVRQNHRVRSSAKVCVEGPVGFEPTTPGLKVRSSTAELRAPLRPDRICSAPVLTTGSASRARTTVAAPPPLDKRPNGKDNSY